MQMYLLYRIANKPKLFEVVYKTGQCKQETCVVHAETMLGVQECDATKAR